MLNGGDNENGVKILVDLISKIIIYTKILLNSDWLRKECSSSVKRVRTCNTSAKLVARVKITNGF